MEGSPSPSAVTGLTALILVFFLTVPSVVKLCKSYHRQKYSRINALYEDEDGIATEETQKEYSATAPKYLALLSTVIGFIASVISASFTTINRTRNLYVENWLLFGSWSLLLIQTVYNTVERNSVKRFDFGRAAAISAIVILAAMCVRLGLLLSPSKSLWSYNDLLSGLDAVQTIATIFCCVSSLSLPRRPALSYGIHLVDGQYTTSALGRYTFEWAGIILALAKSKRTLDLLDLPKLHFRGRASYLSGHFGSMKKQDKLWRAITINHGGEIIFQIFYAMLYSAGQFVPQLAMYWLLKTIEQRSEEEPIAKAAWGLVFALGSSVILASWAQAWAHWMLWARLAQPVRSELSAMIFTKATRRKDVKGVGKAKITGAVVDLTGTTATETNSPSGHMSTETDPNNGVDLVQGAVEKVEDEETDDIQKSRQSTINLVGVDTKRISDFCIFHTQFAETGTELIVSIIFLVNLIRWESLLAGFAVFCVLLPINIIVSKGYSNAQDHLMKVRDQKMVVVTEALQGIRQIKFSAEEPQWQAKIAKQRAEELKTQWRVFCYDTALISIWILGPIMLSAVSLTVYATLTGGLSASVAFTTLTVMGAIEVTLAIIPELTSDFLEAWVSVNRIDEYLNAPEIDKYISPGDSIIFSEASVAWPSNSQEHDSDRFILKDVNIKFPAQALSVISGKTGSGKSLLLAAIIGEADKLSGVINVPTAPTTKERFDHKANKSGWIIDSSIAFVAQIPWIENASIRDNITFGLPYDSGRFDKVVTCCALEKDLQILPDGVETDIGANGINLSGGQRWRITFARALYSRAGILILDDIFSAVDAHVGRQLFEDALTGELGTGRTRILVTHHVGLVLPKTQYAVILGEGTIQHAANVEELQRIGALEQIIKREIETEEKEVEKEEDIDDSSNNALNKMLSRVTQDSTHFDDSGIDLQGKSKPKKFTEDEKRETGSIKLGIYKLYLSTSGGVWFWVPIACLFTAHQIIILSRSWFISLWTMSYHTESSLVHHLHYQYLAITKYVYTPEAVHHELSYYLGLYMTLSLILCVTGTLRYFVVFLAAIKASKRLFESLTYAVLRAPLRWLDITPVGRILSRFTTDFAAIDSRLGGDLGSLMYQGISLLGIIIAGLFVSPWMLIFAVALLMICVWVTTTFLAGARNVKRLESSAKSPIFEQFGSALAGIGTIRAFDKVDAYIERMFEKIDQHSRAFWYLWLFNRWLAFRLNVLGGVFAFLVAAIIVYSGIDASLAGFALSFALQYSSAIVWAARNYANVELSMNSVERVDEYSNIVIESQDSTIDVPAAWPTEGRLQVSSLVAGYAPDLPPVLKGLTFTVEKNQRIGVVGRTGAGKSSLTLALFRFLEASQGSIHIDGIDISQINLHELRSRLAIIPQDPVLFSGTVRSNLDAFDNHTDAELYDALERVHLIRSTGTVSRDEGTGDAPPGSGTKISTDTNTNIFHSLSSRISEGGLNLSQGQRQLLCLARAIVSRPKIMVLDEATSAVDMATDVLIQRSIREEFQDSTLIVIAHRLSTIADFDRILVMDNGKAAEFDKPGVLLDKKDGVFAGMVSQSGEVDRLREIIDGLEQGEENSQGSGKGRA